MTVSDPCTQDDANDMRRARKARYQAAARANGWEYSPAHGGWVHEDEKRCGEYQVQADAEDACFLHDIEASALTGNDGSAAS